MRVYELIVKALEFAGAASPFEAGENTAGILALMHLSKIKRVVVAVTIADVLRQRSQSSCTLDSVRRCSWHW
jgi:hypothetical protein